MNLQAHKAIDFRLAYYSGDRKIGSIVLATNSAGQLNVRKIETEPESGKTAAEKDIFIGLTEKAEVIVLDPKSKQIKIMDKFPADAFPAHIYTDPSSNRAWFMNDGDKETGNDRLNCGENGSSVTVIENANSSSAKYLKTICVGRGHHQANFCYPSSSHPEVPAYALISNLKDGTISVIDNNPESAAFLSVVKVIDLCEPDKEENSSSTIPNNAFPHGLVYSSQSGKIYNLNNGYGTVAVIDPITLEIESRFNFKGFSNLFITPDGRFIIGRGADRKSDAEHVIAKLSVLDVKTNQVIDSMELKDIYISKYFFNPEASRLYLTTSSSGSDQQKVNLKTDALLVFDISDMPALSLVNETRLGSSSGTLDFACTNGQTEVVFSSNAEEGMLIMLNKDGQILEKAHMDDSNSHSRLWCF